MRNAKKIIVRLLIVTGLILLAYLGFTFYGNVLKTYAKANLTPAKALDASKDVPIDVKSWQDKLKDSGENVKEEYSHSSLGEHPSITYAKLLSEEYLFCSGKGWPLRSNPTWTLKGTYTATPAEAWVLAEAANNVHNGKTEWRLTKTQNVYEGKVSQLKKYKEIDGYVVYKVKKSDTISDEDDDNNSDGVDEETYVIKDTDNKYYYVTLSDPTGGGDGKYSYVQYAWWQVSTYAQDKNKYNPGDKSGGLAQEAKAFENYVEEMNGGDKSWPKNDDGTFKIDYKVGMTPTDSSKLKVAFDANTNKYMVGPIKINYTRRTTQQGKRAKVDFAGITKMTLVGVDASGNEVHDSKGESIYVQNQNFKIIYADEATHKKKADAFKDTDATYSFPYNGEEFYLAIDYVDDVVALKSFKVDFHYMTAKGSYQIYEGVLTNDDGSKTPQQPIGVPTGPNQKIDVDAAGGLNGSKAAIPVELEIFPTPLDLRTRLSGMVWIDEEEQKVKGTLGIKDDSEKYAADNSVEVVVWKVKYQKNNGKLKEIEREKAIAWDSSGKTIDFINNRIYIKDGKYSIPNIQVPSEEGLDTSKYVMSYDVEFVYDGQTYEATEYLKSAGKDNVGDKLSTFAKTVEETRGADSDYSRIKGTSAKIDFSKNSYVVENSDERKNFDSYYSEFYGNGAIDTSNGTTKGKATGGVGGSQYSNVEYGERGQSAIDLNYTSSDVGSEGYTKKVSSLVTHDANGFIYDQYKFVARTSEAGLVFPYETKYHTKKSYYDNLEINNSEYKPVDEYFNQINLGLLERYHTDLSVLKDLYKAKVVVNEQETDYRYNSLGTLTEDSLNKTLQPQYRQQTYSIGLYNSDYKYRSSAYDSIGVDKEVKQLVKALKEGTELRLFVTYKIQIYNGSEYTDASINEFKDYYDKSLTMITEDTKAYISNDDKSSDTAREEKVVAEKPYYRKLKNGADVSSLYSWNRTDDLKNGNIDDGVAGDVAFEKVDSSNGEYNVAKCTGLNAISGSNVNSKMTLEPGESYEIYVTYEVDQSGYKKIQEGQDANRDSSLLGTKANIAEISRYSSVYTSEGVARHKTTRYKAGQISGRVDRDSAPDNINLNAKDSNGRVDSKFFEDDTETAPILTVGIKTADESRTLNGVVWEDSRGDKQEANGVFDAGETTIPGVDVSLVEKIKVDVKDFQEGGKLAGKNIPLDVLDYEFEYIWKNNSFGNDDISTAKTNDNGIYTFKDFLTGNYVVRFEYGNNDETLKYNGQDYKNTAYQTGMTNIKASEANGKIYEGTTDGQGVKTGEVSTLNNEWQDLSAQASTLNNARVSDARDYEPRRLKVNAYSRTITNGNAEVLAGYVDEDDKNITDEYKQILKANKDKLKEYTSMVANTAKFVVSVEKQSDIQYDPNVSSTDGGSHDYTIANMDFGITKRPETRIYTQKEISKLELLKDDGQEVVLSVSCDEEGNIIKSGDTSDSNSTMRVDKVTEINKELLSAGTQGFKYVAVEASYLKGLQVKITYNIKVINDSETDYTTEKIARIKDAQTLFNKAEEYESGKDIENGLSPFNTGTGIIYGKYVGLHYYTNNTDATADTDLTSKYKYGYNGDSKDVVAKTTVDQLVDYIDNDISISKDDTEGIANQSWVDSSELDRKNKLSKVSYVNNEVDDKNLQDNKERTYVGTSKNNIAMSENEMMSNDLREITYTITALNEDGTPKTVNDNGVVKPQLETKTIKMYSTNEGEAVESSTTSMYNTNITKELAPGENTSITIVTSAQASEEGIKNMNYDNLVEIAMYSNVVGRRDTKAIPGNANMIAKQKPAYEAGYDRVVMKDENGNVLKDDNGNARYEFKPKTTTIAAGTAETERDAFAARDTVTFSEPTGLNLQRQRMNMAIRVILVGLIISAIAIMIATVVVVFKKTRYEDEDIVNQNNKQV